MNVYVTYCVWSWLGECAHRLRSRRRAYSAGSCRRSLDVQTAESPWRHRRLAPVAQHTEHTDRATPLDVTALSHQTYVAIQSHYRIRYAERASSRQTVLHYKKLTCRRRTARSNKVEHRCTTTNLPVSTDINTTPKCEVVLSNFTVQEYNKLTNSKRRRANLAWW